MPKVNLHKRDYLTSIDKDLTLTEFDAKLSPKQHTPSRKVNRSPYLTARNVDYRWGILDNSEAKSQLLDAHTESQMDSYAKNIEFFIGTLKMPVGTAGPLRVNGLFAQGDYQVPLATTEAALVASYNRGANLITACGGASAMLLNEGVTRAPLVSPSSR